jgi:hypothetical protein
VESLNPYKNDLISLTSLKNKVDAFAELCCPDFVYTEDATRGLVFEPVDLRGITADERVPDSVGMRLQDGDECPVHLFTRWSRGQLLGHLGTREKWFQSVSLEQQALELQARAHTFDQHMFRTMRTYEGNFRLVRGLVSSKYGDIADTLILDTLVKLLPGGWALRWMSGKTDRALYVYAITRDPVTIPGTNFTAFPGALVKNSEVGYTSLWVLPMMYTPAQNAAFVLEQKHVLRRVHRGRPGELEAALRDALGQLSGLWGGIEARLRGLQAIYLVDEDAAVAAMRKVLLQVGGSKLLALRCEQTYRAAGHSEHNGLTIFEAILARVHREHDRNNASSLAAIAGAVLLLL